jgi:hypothetical protein
MVGGNLPDRRCARRRRPRCRSSIWRARMRRCSAWSAPATRRQFQLRAALERAASRRSSAGTMHPEMLPKLGEVAEELGCPSRRWTAGHGARPMCDHHDHLQLRAADGRLVSPGTHIACMGTDTKGKQEVDPALLAVPRHGVHRRGGAIHQHRRGAARRRGHGADPGESDRENRQIGAVINGDPSGSPHRDTPTDEITLFDGTGVHGLAGPIASPAPHARGTPESYSPQSVLSWVWQPWLP